MIGKKAIPLGDYWLSHPQRRQYQGIEFAPPGSAARPGYYNLWQGFAVEPKKGDCSKFLAHVKDNAARGDEATLPVDRRLVGADPPAAHHQDGNGAGAARPVRRRQDQDRGGVRLADRRALPAGRLAALHHRPVQLAHGVAAGAARRRGVLGRRQGERRHAARPGDRQAITCSNTRTSTRSASRTTSGCS